MNWMFMSPQNSYIEALTSSVMVFGACGKYLGLDEVLKMVRGGGGDTMGLVSL